MTVRMTSGQSGIGTLGIGYEPVCLYDTVDGMAFGPTFENRAEAEAFIRWFEGKHIRDGALAQIEIRNLPYYTAAEQKQIADKWRAFLADHVTSECPYDEPSAGEGFLGDRDASDGSGAWTPVCTCECHERRVAVLGGYAE